MYKYKRPVVCDRTTPEKEETVRWWPWQYLQMAADTSQALSNSSISIPPCLRQGYVRHITIYGKAQRKALQRENDVHQISKYLENYTFN